MMKPSLSAAGILPQAAVLSDSEVQLIDICVRISQFVGLPKSVGEIYGLLFVSSSPLSLDVVCQKLSLSKGSASQGLKHLRAYGAVKSNYIAGDRRDHYIAETDLNTLLNGFLKERIAPGIADLAERLGRIEEETAKLSPAEQRAAKERLAQLRQWQRQAAKILPLANTLLGK